MVREVCTATKTSSCLSACNSLTKRARCAEAFLFAEFLFLIFARGVSAFYPADFCIIYM